MLLQSKPVDFCVEKQSEGPFFHRRQKPRIRDHKMRSQKPPKRTQKLFSGSLGSTSRMLPKHVTMRSNFLRWKLSGGFAVFEPWDLEMAPWLYRYEKAAMVCCKEVPQSFLP